MSRKKLPATEAIALDFTIPQRVHKCPRADGIKANPLYISNYPRLHRVPTSSQMSKSGWCLKKLARHISKYPRLVQARMVLEHVLPATAAMILDFTRPQRAHNCPRADGIEKTFQLRKQFILDFTKPPRIHNCPTANGI